MSVESQVKDLFQTSRDDWEKIDTNSGEVLAKMLAADSNRQWEALVAIAKAVDKIDPGVVF